ncbi:hypothetical protein EDD35_4293 [Amycolatopsis thermoflava]|uniref:Uncharacterized protein n=2 Tax=Pseudonocardiaceae TaxID=2070 RepID=A0A3N2H0C5_9PSEU|nr:hypothetical protein EDD35_4293 [Amycolatopsis thermoflava]
MEGMFGMAAVWAERTSRRTLNHLHSQLGAAGLVAAVATAPGLTAVVDQHAAAVRDILAAGVEGSAAVAGVVLLAGYARGLLDHAREAGWRLTVPQGPESGPMDWLTFRLLAVCTLANSMDDPHYRQGFELELH